MEEDLFKNEKNNDLFYGIEEDLFPTFNPPKKTDNQKDKTDEYKGKEQ